MTPDPEKSCGPYRPRQLKGAPPQPRAPGPSWVSRKSHDTISVVAIDEDGRIAAGSSSNGANHKVKLPDQQTPALGVHETIPTARRSVPGDTRKSWALIKPHVSRLCLLVSAG